MRGFLPAKDSRRKRVLELTERPNSTIFRILRAKKFYPDIRTYLRVKEFLRSGEILPTPVAPGKIA
jgi:hypothetical protein